MARTRSQKTVRQIARRVSHRVKRVVKRGKKTRKNIKRRASKRIKKKPFAGIFGVGRRSRIYRRIPKNNLVDRIKIMRWKRGWDE